MEITYVNHKKITGEVVVVFVRHLFDEFVGDKLGPLHLAEHIHILLWHQPVYVVRAECAPLHRQENPEPEHDSSGVYICKSIVNYLRQENFICKSEGIHLNTTSYPMSVKVDMEKHIMAALLTTAM